MFYSVNCIIGDFPYMPMVHCLYPRNFPERKLFPWKRKADDLIAMFSNSPVAYSSSICPSLRVYGGLVAEAMGLVHVGWEEVRLSPRAAGVYSSWEEGETGPTGSRSLLQLIRLVSVFPAYSSSLPFHFCCAHAWDSHLQGSFPSFSLPSFLLCRSLGCQRPFPSLVHSWPIGGGSCSSTSPGNTRWFFLLNSSYMPLLP